MVRKRFCTLVFTVATAAAIGSPANAHTIPGATDVTYEALPCAVACAYWVNNGFTPCEVPFPPGSYDDVLTTPAPTAPPGRIIILEATIYPKIDYDLFACDSAPPYTQLSQGLQDWGAPCDGGPLREDDFLPLACHEDMSLPLMAGKQVILRAYNWSDVFPAPGQYRFVFI